MRPLLHCALAILLGITCTQTFAQVAINSDGSPPVAGAMLDVQSTDLGFLVPRMSSAHRSAMGALPDGMIVYDTDESAFFVYANGWIKVLAGSVPFIVDADGDTRIQVEESADEDIIRFDMEGTEFFRMDSGRLEVVNTNGSIFIGNGAGANSDLVTEIGNIAIGAGALATNPNRRGLVAIGDSALFANGAVVNDSIFDATRNTAVGWKAMQFNTQGFCNTALGYRALNFDTTGTRNTALGCLTLFSNSSGSFNTAVGNRALINNTEGIRNVAVGHQVMQNNLVGNRNTALGNWALFSADSSSHNTAVGHSALLFHRSGDENTGVGYEVLHNDSTGFANTAVGKGALFSNKTGNNNTAVGYQADVAFDSLENASAIGAYAVVERSNALVLGSGVHVGINTPSPDTTLHVQGSIKMVDGNQAAGRVLTSDAEGIGAWADLPAALHAGTETTQDLYNRLEALEAITIVLSEQNDLLTASIDMHRAIIQTQQADLLSLQKEMHVMRSTSGIR